MRPWAGVSGALGALTTTSLIFMSGGVSWFLYLAVLRKILSIGAQKFTDPDDLAFLNERVQNLASNG